MSGVAIGVAGLVFAALPFDANTVVDAFVAAVLVVLAATDIERGIIPNRVVLPATAIVLVVRVAAFPTRAAEWLLAALLAGIVLILPRLFSDSAIGMGDVKLAMLIGAALGWGVVAAVPMGFVCVFPVALFVVARRGLAARKTTIPFGPFMALGALIILFAPYLLGLQAT